MDRKKIPLGTDDFEKLRKENGYYVDKTGLLSELLNNCSEVNLFTRPRRFGKTLNMSMLKNFFEIGSDPVLFDGLAIQKDTELWEKYMGKYPVIFLTLKGAEGLNYAEAKSAMTGILRREADRHNKITFDDRLDVVDKEIILSLRRGIMDVSDGILELSRILYQYYGQKVIILIDEYDVPLQKAELSGYYHEMVRFISRFFSNGMKTNPYMEFAVVTGCLRVAKESIFTGFNNVVTHSIADKEYDEWFGFSDQEVRTLLNYYGCFEHMDTIKAWYDGYRFGDCEVYCPWDVMNWLYRWVRSKDARPQNYWINTSGNDMIYRFAELADTEAREQLGLLMEGKKVRKKLNFNLTYQDIDHSIENLWSVLFTTGYLTQSGQDENGYYELSIPNREIMDTFVEIVNKWFHQKVLDDHEGLTEFFQALDAGDAQAMEECLNIYMQDSISYIDGGNVKDKETFYHGFILGMLKNRAKWEAISNREAGIGRFDVAAYPKRGNFAVILEFKYSKNPGDLESDAKLALNQINDKRYDQYFAVRRLKSMIHFGIAFHKKQCRVLAEILENA